MRFTLLGKKKELMIPVLTDFVVNDVSKSIVYITLGVNNRIKKITRSKAMRNSYITFG